MPVKLHALALALLLAVLAPAAHADLNDAVNWARLQGCHRPVQLQRPLQASAQLQLAARQMAAGRPRSAALSSAGYLAAEASMVHVSGAMSDSQAANLLATRDCAVLTDAKLREVGIQRTGRDIWIVLAAPVALPVSDAALVQRQILELVNNARASGRRCGSREYPAAPPLALNALLTSTALAHSREMAAYDEFEHAGRDGSSPAARVARSGYGGFSIVGENIAAGAMTPAEVTQGWLDSPAHCENIMDPRFSEIGIAFAVNTASAEVVYWTQDFAAPRRAH
jgi:uncharacterized protein YkwD